MENVAETALRVRYQETDQMGVVYHTNYLVWFEVGRTEMMRERGFSYKDLEEKGLLLPVVDIHCKYEYPARYDDLVIIRTRISQFNRSKIVFAYEVIHQETGRRLVKGESIHLWVDKKMKRINLKQAFPELYTLLFRLTAEGGK